MDTAFRHFDQGRRSKYHTEPENHHSWQDRNSCHLFELANLPKTDRVRLVKEAYLALSVSPWENFCHLVFCPCWLRAVWSTALIHLSRQTISLFHWLIIHISTPLYEVGFELAMVTVVVGTVKFSELLLNPKRLKIPAQDPRTGQCQHALYLSHYHQGWNSGLGMPISMGNREPW